MGRVELVTHSSRRRVGPITRRNKLTAQWSLADSGNTSTSPGSCQWRMHRVLLGSNPHCTYNLLKKFSVWNCSLNSCKTTPFAISAVPTTTIWSKWPKPNSQITDEMACFVSFSHFDVIRCIVITMTDKVITFIILYYAVGSGTVLWKSCYVGWIFNPSIVKFCVRLKTSAVSVTVIHDYHTQDTRPH